MLPTIVWALQENIAGVGAFLCLDDEDDLDLSISGMQADEDMSLACRQTPTHTV